MFLTRADDRITTDSDADALRRVAGGDVSAIGHLYDRHARSLLDFAARLIGTSEAEDVVHTVFLRATRLAATYKNSAPSARSWLFGIAAHVAQERRRSIRRMFRALIRLKSELVIDQSTLLGDRRDLQRGLTALSDAQRLVLLLSDVEGFTGEEIADMLRIPVGTVWTRLHHARRKLRAMLRGEG